MSGVDGCRTLVDSVCSRIAECAAPSARSASYQDCTFGFELQVSCEEVRSLGPTYDECIDSIPETDCETIRSTVPQSCHGVLLF
jgi:hypothetical protein